jgi:D-alanine-D-alanine ligase
MIRVLILGGGPDSERDVSIASATAIYQACQESPLSDDLTATLKIVDSPTVEDIESWSCDVVFPVLHGRFGEGGQLQSMLEESGVVFVGSKTGASQLAMDKVATKLIAGGLAIPTPQACLFDPGSTKQRASSDSDEYGLDHAEMPCPLNLPVVIKPVSEGSSVGLYICEDESSWSKSVACVRDDLRVHPERIYMIEQMIRGRELTVSVVVNETGELEALPVIEIAPSTGVYDYEAKYARNDTVYTTRPDIADEVTRGVKDAAIRICNKLGVRHLARVDFLLSDELSWSLLEVNTMPGFTKTSLLPMAARANGIELWQLCKHLIQSSLSDHQTSSSTQ